MNKRKILDSIREACKDIKDQIAGIQLEQTLEEFIEEFSYHSAKENKDRK